MKVTAIIAAAGKGIRLNKGIKALVEIQGKAILYYSLKVFQESLLISDILIAGPEENNKQIEELIDREGFSKVRGVVKGGEFRQDSVNNCLEAITWPCEMVAIHDAARPLIDSVLIEKVITAARGTYGAVLAIPVVDTIKEINKKGEISQTLSRDLLWAAQTPQVFPLKIIRKAYLKAKKDKFYGTDDSLLVERIGYSVKIVRGSYDNIKITTPRDIRIAEEILGERN